MAKKTVHVPAGETTTKAGDKVERVAYDYEIDSLAEDITPETTAADLAGFAADVQGDSTPTKEEMWSEANEMFDTYELRQYHADGYLRDYDTQYDVPEEFANQINIHVSYGLDGKHYAAHYLAALPSEARAAGLFDHKRREWAIPQRNGYAHMSRAELKSACEDRGVSLPEHYGDDCAGVVNEVLNRKLYDSFGHLPSEEEMDVEGYEFSVDEYVAEAKVLRSKKNRKASTAIANKIIAKAEKALRKQQRKMIKKYGKI